MNPIESSKWNAIATRGFGLRRFVVCLTFSLLLINDLWGQPPDRTKIPEKFPTILEGGSVKPDAMIHLRDSNGEAIYIPLRAYEDFERFLKERLAGSSPLLPRNLLESITGEIRIGDGFADIEWLAQTQVSEGNGSVLRIPLGMSNQNLIEAPLLQRGDASFIRLAPSGGYEWWLQASEARRYEIRFRTRMKVNTVANQSTLRFQLTDAPSKLILSIAGANQEIQAVGSGTPVVETSLENDTTKATIFGVGGTQNISWKNAAGSVTLDALEVESLTRWDLESTDRPWTGSTRFTVRPYGRKKGREFEVKLPNGMAWLPPSTGAIEEGIELIPIEEGPKSGDQPSSKEGTTGFRVRIAESIQEGPIEFAIALEWRRLPDGMGAFQLQGPLCVGTQRHEGRVELEVPSGVRLGWTPTSSLILQQQERPSEATLPTRFSFRFNDPTYRFQGILSREESRLRIRPRYAVHVEPQRIGIQGIVEFPVDPASIPELRLHFGNWELDRLEWDGRAIDFTLTDSGEVELRSQDFSNATSTSGPGLSQPTRGLKIFGSIPWDVGKASDLRLDLPRFSSRQEFGQDRMFDHGTGGLVITHATNMKLESDGQSLAGLIAEQRVPTSMEELLAASLLDQGRYYRFQSDTASPSWSGKWSRQAQNIGVRGSFDISIHDAQAHVHQRFDLRVENEPIRQLQALIPKSLADGWTNGTVDLRFQFNGEPVDWSLATVVSDETLSSSWDPTLWTAVDLVTFDLTGSSELLIDSTLNLNGLQAGAKIDFTIPFAWPLLPNDLDRRMDIACQLRTERNLECSLPPAMRLDRRTIWSRKMDVQVKQSSPGMEIQIRELEKVTYPEIEIERVWLQTAINRQQVRSRFVARFYSEEPKLSVSLIKQAGSSPFQDVFLLDGKRIETVFSDGKHTLALPEGNTKTIPHTLEVWGWSDRNTNWLESISANCPKIENANQGFPFLWQVLLPKGDSLWSSSSSLMPEYRWTWESFGFVRESRWSQSKLEEWSGATRQPSIGEMTASYVLSSTDPWDLSSSPSLWIQFVPKFILWCPIGLLILCGTAAWMNVAFCRKPIFLALIGVGLALVIPLANDLAILLYQAIAFGSLLVLTVLLARWAIDHRVQRRSVFSSRQLQWSRNPSEWSKNSGTDGSARGSATQSTTQGHDPPITASLETR